MKRTNRPEKDRKERKMRPPINGKGDIMSVTNKEDGYTYYIFNDKGTRLSQYQDYGWEVVSSDDVKVGSRSANVAGTTAQMTVDSSDGTQGVVMRIPTEWYEDDKKVRQDRISEKEAAITGEQNDGTYGKVSID